MRTDDELKKLAMELVQNQIFMSDQLRRPDDLTMVFIPLLMLSEEQIEQLKKEEVVHFYAYNKDALPRSVNGYPCFMTAHTLNREEYRKVYEYEGKIRAAMGEAIDGKKDADAARDKKEATEE